MASPTQWVWVWASSGSWWWTGKPGVLQSMGLQRVRHDWVTELNWTSFVGTGNMSAKVFIIGEHRGLLVLMIIKQYINYKPLMTEKWFTAQYSPGSGQWKDRKKMYEPSMVSMILTVMLSPGAKNNQVPRGPHLEERWVKNLRLCCLLCNCYYQPCVMFLLHIHFTQMKLFNLIFIWFIICIY